MSKCWFILRVDFLLLFLKRGVVEEFLDEVDVAEKHPATAVPLETESVQGVAREEILTSAQMSTLQGRKTTYPSVYSACRSPKYASHLFPITLPHVKHRIGMIMVAALSKSGRSRNSGVADFRLAVALRLLFQLCQSSPFFGFV